MKAIWICKFRGGGKEKLIYFIKAGEKGTKSGKNILNMLLTAPDWKLFTDLRRELIFPSYIAQTILRLDLIILSNNTKKIIIWELSVSWEDNITRKWKKAWKISGIGQRVSAKRFENLLQSNWSGMQGFCGTFIKPSTNENWNHGIYKEENLDGMIWGRTEQASWWIWIKNGMISGVRHKKRKLRQAKLSPVLVLFFRLLPALHSQMIDFFFFFFFKFIGGCRIGEWESRKGTYCCVCV